MPSACPPFLYVLIIDRVFFCAFINARSRGTDRLLHYFSTEINLPEAPGYTKMPRPKITKCCLIPKAYYHDPHLEPQLTFDFWQERLNIQKNNWSTCKRKWVFLHKCCSKPKSYNSKRFWGLLLAGGRGMGGSSKLGLEKCLSLPFWSFINTPLRCF